MGFRLVYVHSTCAYNAAVMCNVCRMEKIEIEGHTYRYYVKECKMGFDEDDVHEFKGHLNFTKDQIPPYCHDANYDRPSRQPISK